MGWCSAIDIMDTALAAAQEAVSAVLAETDCPEPPAAQTVQAMDDALRPFVTKLAKVLRDGDWDCIEESDYFDRFPQEMLGYDDSEFEAWLVERVKDAADYQTGELGKWTDRLNAFREKTGRN